jgi:heterodisulfide reductase subunit E
MQMALDRLTLFWIAMAVTVALFFAAFGLKLSFWSAGQVNDARGRRVRRAKAWIVFTNGLRVVFSRRFGVVSKTFILDGLLHRSLWSEDRYRWAIHFLMLSGFLSLFIVTMITGFFEEILHFLLNIDTPLVQFITDKDTPLMASLNEIFGLVILIGLILALVRRFVRRPAQLRTTPFDVRTLALLAIIMITAYPIEAFRLIMEDVPSTLAWFSFLGYPLSLLIRPLDLNWPGWHYWTFMVHIAACMALAVSLPFSKFFHVLISPIIATANGLPRRQEEAHS